MKNRYIVILAALMLAILGIEEIVLIGFMPTQNFALLPAIPVYFTIFGAVAINLVYTKQNPSVSSILGTKMLKILLSLVFILAYVFLVKTNAVAFLSSYLIYFLAYLLFETWMLSSINKKK